MEWCRFNYKLDVLKVFLFEGFHYQTIRNYNIFFSLSLFLSPSLSSSDYLPQFLLFSFLYGFINYFLQSMIICDHDERFKKREKSILHVTSLTYQFLKENLNVKIVTTRFKNPMIVP